MTSLLPLNSEENRVFAYMIYHHLFEIIGNFKSSLVRFQTLTSLRRRRSLFLFKLGLPFQYLPGSLNDLIISGRQLQPSLMPNNSSAVILGGNVFVQLPVTIKRARAICFGNFSLPVSRFGFLCTVKNASFSSASTYADNVPMFSLCLAFFRKLVPCVRESSLLYILMGLHKGIQVTRIKNRKQRRHIVIL